MNHCKHFHFDGVMHTPCHQCEIDQLRAENEKLKAVIAKCACSLHAITKRANYLDVLDIAREANETLAAIKEIEK